MNNMMIEIEDSSFMHNNESIMREILQELKDIINTPIIVSNPHGKHAEPYTGTDKLQIYFWSSAQESPQTVIQSKIFGLSPEGYGAEDAFKPSNGPTIYHIKSPEGIIVAEVDKTYPNTLFILFDLPHQPVMHVRIHLREIMSIFVDFWLNLNPINKDIINIKIAMGKSRQNKKTATTSIEKLNYIDNLVVLDCQKKYASELDKIKNEAMVTISNQDIIISLNKTDRIIISPLSGLYAISLGKTSIPFEEICNGPAKSGLAQLLGRDELYSAYQIINRWLKNYKGGK